MRDPYQVLGVKRGASADEIKRAFRTLAKAHHPDRNQKDPKAEARFAEVNSAYEILGDDAKRKAFDRGEIDADGKPRASMHPGFDAGGFAGGPGGFRFDFGTSAPFGQGGSRAGADPRDVFSDLFRQFEPGSPGAGQRSAGGPRRGAGVPPGEDVELAAQVSLETVATGGAMRLMLQDGREVEVKVPQGVANGATIRLKGQGHPSLFGGARGDALVTLGYARHPRFQVDGADLRAAVAVPLRLAIVGGSVRVPTLQGEVEMTVPAWTSGGKPMRLRGKGLPLKERTGDLLITLDIDLGPQDAEVEGFFRRRKG